MQHSASLAVVRDRAVTSLISDVDVILQESGVGFEKYQHRAIFHVTVYGNMCFPSGAGSALEDGFKPFGFLPNHRFFYVQLGTGRKE